MKATGRRDHAHKGPVSKRESLKNIPLIYMSPAELDDTLDPVEGGAGTTADVLDMARRGHPERMSVLVAAAVLTLPDGTRRAIIEQFEYGDGDGLKFIGNVVRSARRKLEPGESVEREVWRLDWHEVLAQPS